MNSRKEIWEIVKLSLDLIDPVLVCQVFAHDFKIFLGCFAIFFPSPVDDFLFMSCGVA